ncbi:hypothetical protein D3C71_1102500 [compost metagenome]
MHPHRHHAGQVRAADDDRHLVALGHAAAEHRELGHAHLAQRYRRARHQLIGVGGLLGALLQVAQGNLCAAVEAAIGRVQQHPDHGRQQQAKPGHFHRAVIQRLAGAPARRHRLRFAQVAQRGQGIEIHPGQRHPRAVFGRHAQHPRAGGGEVQVVAPCGGLGKGAEAAAGAAVQGDERQALAVAVIDHHRAAGTQLGDRAFAADRGRIAEQGRSSIRHGRGRGGHRGFHSGDGGHRFQSHQRATQRRIQCGCSSVA